MDRKYQAITIQGKDVFNFILVAFLTISLLLSNDSRVKTLLFIDLLRCLEKKHNLSEIFVKICCYIRCPLEDIYILSTFYFLFLLLTEVETTSPRRKSISMNMMSINVSMYDTTNRAVKRHVLYTVNTVSFAWYKYSRFSGLRD